jgi:hypothetical protein
MTPHNLVEIYRNFEGIYCLQLQGKRESEARKKTTRMEQKGTKGKACFISCWPCPMTLMMEAVRSSKMAINVYQTTRCHIPEDINL